MLYIILIGYDIAQWNTDVVLCKEKYALFPFVLLHQLLSK